MKNTMKEVNMELEYYEINGLSDIQNSRLALVELQKAIIPFAEQIAKRQRIWWDGVLEARGLTRDGTRYAIENGRTIVNQQEVKS